MAIEREKNQAQIRDCGFKKKIRPPTCGNLCGANWQTFFLFLEKDFSLHIVFSPFFLRGEKPREDSGFRPFGKRGGGGGGGKNEKRGGGEFLTPPLRRQRLPTAADVSAVSPHTLISPHAYFWCATMWKF